MNERSYQAGRLAEKPGLRHDTGMKALWTLAVAGLVGACTQFPDLDASETPGVAEAPYPALVPLETLTTAAAPPRAQPEMIEDVTARAAALDARAERLQGASSGPGSDVQRRLALLRQRAEALRAMQ